MQLAQGSWILVGSMPCAGAEEAGGAGSGDVVVAVAVWSALGGMSSGGSICGIRQVGQANSVSPGATARIMRQPAQRTRISDGGGGGGRGGGGVGTDGCVISE